MINRKSERIKKDSIEMKNEIHRNFYKIIHQEVLIWKINWNI